MPVRRRLPLLRACRRLHRGERDVRGRHDHGRGDRHADLRRAPRAGARSAAYGGCAGALPRQAVVRVRRRSVGASRRARGARGHRVLSRRDLVVPAPERDRIRALDRTRRSRDVQGLERSPEPARHADRHDARPRSPHPLGARRYRPQSVLRLRARPAALSHRQRRRALVHRRRRDGSDLAGDDGTSCESDHGICKSGKTCAGVVSTELCAAPVANLGAGEGCDKVGVRTCAPPLVCNDGKKPCTPAL